MEIGKLVDDEGRFCEKDRSCFGENSATCLENSCSSWLVKETRTIAAYCSRGSVDVVEVEDHCVNTKDIAVDITAYFSRYFKEREYS